MFYQMSAPINMHLQRDERDMNFEKTLVEEK